MVSLRSIQLVRCVVMTAVTLPLVIPRVCPGQHMAATEAIDHRLAASGKNNTSLCHFGVYGSGRRLNADLA